MEETEEMTPICPKETVDTYCYTQRSKDYVVLAWGLLSTEPYRAALVTADTRHAIMSQRRMLGLFKGMNSRLSWIR